MEIDDSKEEEHQEEEIAKESDSGAMGTMKVLGKVPGKYLTKIAELQNNKKIVDGPVQQGP
jgi:hypothetical protein